MRAIPSASLPGAAPEAFASPAAKPESRSIMSRVRDRAAALIGTRTRTALMALGLGFGLGGGAAAEETARMDAPTASGANVELLADTAKPAVPMAEKADAAKPILPATDAAPAGVLLASVDTEGNKKPKEAAEPVPNPTNIFGIKEYVQRPEAAKYGLAGAFSDSYVAYRAKLAQWRKEAPKDAISYEIRKGEVVSAYVIEGRFAEVRYPENVVDAYNRKERVDAAALRMDGQLTGESLRSAIPDLFSIGVDEAWAKRQVEMENPAALDGDGKLDPGTILQDTKQDLKARTQRWTFKLYPETCADFYQRSLERALKRAKDGADNQDFIRRVEADVKKAREDAKRAAETRLADKAAAAVNALHRLYGTSAKMGNQSEFNPAAVRDERTAALSWITVKEGFGEERPDALLIQKDLATLTIAWQARKDPQAMERIPLLHIGRVKDLSKTESKISASDRPGAYLASLVAKVHAALPAKEWGDLFARSKPAGFDAGSPEHMESLLASVRDDVSPVGGIPQSLRAEIRRGMELSLNIPLVSADEVMAALTGYGAMTGKPGSDEYKRDRELVGKLIPAAFAGAVGLSTEIENEQEGMVAFKKSEITWAKAEATEKEAAIAKAATITIKKIGSLFDQYEKETDAAKRTEIAKQMTLLITGERARLLAIPEDKRDEADRGGLLVCTLLLAKISKEVAKNG